MTGPILSQASQKWRMGPAFGAAALIHFAAIALANIHQHDQVKEPPSGDDAFPRIEITTEVPTDNQTPPPDVVAPLPSPNPTDELFSNERPTSPPVPRQTNTLTAPIVKMRTSVSSSLQSLSMARISALSAPRPEYPYEARRQKVTGNGIVVMTIDFVSGRVTDVMMEESTGSLVLDNAAMTGFRRWRFKPGTVSRVKSPITFTMTGAQH
jgi:TonB family protein